MPLNKKTNYGKINISNNAIATVAADAAMECYGVVGILNKNSLRQKISVLLKRGHYIDGMKIFFLKDSISISLYVAIAYGVKVTEVLREVQKKVKFVLEKTLDVKISSVNVFAQDLKKVD